MRFNWERLARRPESKSRLVIALEAWSSMTGAGKVKDSPQAMLKVARRK